MAVWDPVVDAWQDVPEWAQPWALALAYALLAYVIYRTVRWVAKRAMTRSPRVDRTLASFFQALLTTGGWIFILLAFLGGLGLDAAALLGGVAISGFIIGFALKDTLGNLAAGVLILLNKPFLVGEAVSMKGFEGTVTSVGIAMTRLNTWDGRMVSIPNGAIMGEGVLNFSRNATRRIDVPVGVSGKDDVNAALACMLRVMTADDRVIHDPAPVVVVTKLGEGRVELEARAWIDTTRTNLLGFKTEMTIALKRALEEEGCSIPLPQREMHVFNAPPRGGERGGLTS